MNVIKKRLLVIGFGCILGLCLAALPVHAQTQLTVTNTYAAKFICGVQPDANINAVPDAQAGRYSTKINVHNNTGMDIRFRKKVIQLKGGQVPTPPAFKKIESLPPDWAMESVCRDIYSHLNIVIPPDQPPPYIEGFMIFEVFFPTPTPNALPDDPLDVEGIYTYRGEYPVVPGFAVSEGVSLHIEVYPAKRNRYILLP